MATTDSQTPRHASNVYLFKNGYGMIVKTFEFPSNKDNNKPIELLDPPSSPVHGAFWIQSVSNTTQINSIRTKKTHKFIDKECFTIEDLIKANVDVDVQLLVIDNVTRSKEWISGKIKSVKRTQEQVSDDEDTPYVTNTPVVDTSIYIHPTLPRTSINSAVPSTPVAVRRPMKIQVGNLVVFETTDDGVLALPLTNIQSVRGATLKTTYQQKVFKNCLSIDYQNESGSPALGLMKYLTFGITWVPSYNLVILCGKDPSIKRLRLSSKAVILNDIENINVDNLYCIVGFPNISKFSSVIDPIISGDDVQQFLNRLNQSEAVNLRSHFSYNQSVTSNSIMQQQMIMPTALNNNISGDNQQQQDTNVDDLHLYEFKNVLLKKKERLMLPIFDIEIPYKDVYHCKINTMLAGHIYTRGDEKKQYEEVWHSVGFENLSNFVWTTAPIVITKGEQEQQFIGQDTLTYTLKGATTVVNLTKALNVRVQLDEKVSNTNPKRFTLSRVNYQTDQIEGKILIMNYKSEEVIIVINIALSGKIDNYSIEPKKDTIKADTDVVNQQHEIQWEVQMKPKETVTIKYDRYFNKGV